MPSPDECIEYVKTRETNINKIVTENFKPSTDNC